MFSSLSIPAPHLLQALWENSPNGLILYQVVRDKNQLPIDFRYVLINPVAAALLGATPEELLGQSCQLVFPQGTVLRDHYYQVALTGQKRQLDYQLPTDGRWFEVLLTYQKPDTLLCFLSDITARQQAQFSLQAENRRLNEAQTIGQVGSFEWNLGESGVNWSDELYRMHGLLPQSIPIAIERVEDFFHPDDRNALQALQQLSFQTPGHYALVHRSQGVDGRLFWVNHQFESLANSTGQVVRVHGTVQDITQQRQLQLDLAQTVQSLQAVLDASPASIAYLMARRDASGQCEDLVISVCNQTFADMVGQPVSVLTGLSAQGLDTRYWRGHAWASWLEVLATGQPQYAEQPWGTAGQWIGLAITKQQDGLVLTGLDITAFKQAQEQHQQALLALQASTLDLQALGQVRDTLRQRGELLRMSSHDLRSYIGVIAFSVSLLAQDQSDFEHNPLVSMLQRNVQQATHLLTDLLDYARLEAGQEVRRLAMFDVAPLLLERLLSVHPLGEQQGLRLEHQGPAELVVMGDALQVGRMVQNLLLNALQHTPTGRIRLAWGEASADRWWFSVDDTGPGLPSQQLAELEALKASNEGLLSTGGKGSSSSGEGIGLRIVRQLVDLLAGQLRVESQPGQGTRFSIDLPRHYA
ncbi:sensor histidine kinase [Spirosoma sp.]|uniref:PAS domain-containing sensor histidine kinase n=1 Tax=Spirosoma sp. TaxID=1899569 RepID=UPI00261F8221|nr:sensor histidine kinase [Spirosoma sp.]MCX6212952.1 ATP-binding protein [Spirosoma sp.]